MVASCLSQPYQMVPVPWGTYPMLLAFWESQGRHLWVASKVATIFAEIYQFSSGSVPQLQQVTMTAENRTQQYREVRDPSPHQQGWPISVPPIRLLGAYVRCTAEVGGPPLESVLLGRPRGIPK